MIPTRSRPLRPDSSHLFSCTAIGVLAFLSGFTTGCAENPAEQHESEDTVQAFTHHYIDSDPERPFYPTFLGVQTMQNPADLWSMQEIITEIAPDFIIECGTAAGGSSLFYASVLRQVRPGGRVITIDIEPRLGQSIEALQDRPDLQARIAALADEMIEIITSNSIDPTLVEELRQRTKGRKVMVVLDSCHHYLHVRAEIENYKDIVSPGSYLIVQDTVIDEREEWIDRYAQCPGYEGRGGPGRAVREFLPGQSDFVVDREREKYLLTFFPGGYLRRVE